MDRFNVNQSFSSNFEHVQTKFVGTGHPDMTRHEWAKNHHRDTFASMIGHYDMLSYVAVAENSAVGRARYEMMERMLLPVGPPPASAAAIVVAPSGEAAAAAAARGGASAVSSKSSEPLIREGK